MCILEKIMQKNLKFEKIVNMAFGRNRVWYAAVFRAIIQKIREAGQKKFAAVLFQGELYDCKSFN